MNFTKRLLALLVFLGAALALTHTVRPRPPVVLLEKTVVAQNKTSTPTEVVSPLGVRLQHRARCAPGDPVLIRVKNAGKTKPVVTWNQEELVMVPDGKDWVGVGRELLGEPNKTVVITAQVGNETLESNLELFSSEQPVNQVYMSQQVLSTLTDENRAKELAILERSYSLRTAQQWSKPWAKPIGSATISPFGQARHYKAGDKVNYHYGHDFRGRIGDPVTAVNDGTVIVAQFLTIRGGAILIDHGAGITSMVLHLSAFKVKPGQKVKRGQLIGLVGNTGFSQGPHLHWEMRVRSEATDPMQWVGRMWPE